jgi:DNA (cytosine-5)-methyltransferase 1
MPPKEKLIQLYHHSLELDTQTIVPSNKTTLAYLNIIGNRIESNKGIFTVLITLGIYKLLNPTQDIRYHQVELNNGFSGRSYDTKFITPTLKALGLPSMAESGWLTRSLEQAYPYDFSYQGKITPKDVKNAFLNIVDEIQKNEDTELILMILLKYAADIRDKNKIEIRPIDNPDKLTIQKIMNILDEHFTFKYDLHGGSKLPVIAFYAIYLSLIKELKRYENYTLLPLGSHTASDRTSKSAGDIEIAKNGEIFEAIEIKFDKEIDANIVRIAIEKIHKFNVNRYYILSSKDIKVEDRAIIEELITELKETQGCQIIINGVMHTLKYYLRLVENLEEFLNNYIAMVSKDTELNIKHKEKLGEILNHL